MQRFPYFISLLLALLLPAGAQEGDRQGEAQPALPEHIKAPPAPVRTPEEELATFQLAPGFRAELVAAEPLVVAPVAAQFGADGRLWVVEMPGFMRNPDGAGEREPVGAVVALADTDADGRYDRRTAFVEGLVMPRALALVGDGVLVAEPPHLWFFRDTDGDGKADQKTEVAENYGGTENPEHTANGLMWALDNWIYSANHTVRYRYAGDGKFTSEPTITRGQWGITQDDFGRLYYNNNSDPLRFDAIPAEYLKRNPHFAAGGANVQVVSPRALRLWPARVTPGVNRGYQNLDAEGRLREVTAACGPVIYRGALFPAEVRGDAFVAEPSANLVKRIVLTENAGVVSGANAAEGMEFLASTDERFRPVNLLNGPDGALYIVDFYRGILQHRIYLTSFLRKQVEERELDQGLDRGRIWRIVPANAPRAREHVALARASGGELVKALQDANGWTRDTAQRLLVEQGGAGAAAALRTLALDDTAARESRLHALAVLDGIGPIDPETVTLALQAKDARVAAAAIRAAEPFLRGERGTERRTQFVDRLAGMVETRKEPPVLLQLAVSLGESPTEAAAAALARLVLAAGEQRFLADAIVSGVRGREVELIDRLANHPSSPGEPAEEAVRFATSAVLKSADAARIGRLFAVLAAPGTHEWAKAALLSGVRHFLPKSPDGKSRAGRLPAEPKALLTLAAQDGTALGEAAQRLLADLTWPGKAGANTARVRELNADEQARFERGKAQFAALCAPCHQPNGQGLPGLAPSLVFSKWVLGDARIAARIVLNGKVRENMAMPPWKGALDDEAIAGLLTFLRRSWGNEAEAVAPSVVHEARAATADREVPFTEAELEALARTLTSPANP